MVQARPFIKIAVGTIDDHATISAGVTILADPGAKLVAAGTPALTVTGSPTVTVKDLRITGSSIGVLVGASDSPMLTLDHVVIDDNSGAGINVAGGTLVMSRCVLSVNSGGGAIVSATFDITNSLFVANGNGGSSTGGATLTPNGTSVFRFNTVANNVSSTTTSTVRGINCTIPFAMTSDIVTGNLTSGSCSFDYSLFDVGAPSGHNKVGDPSYLNQDTSDPLASNYYRISATSAAIDSADPTSTIVVDIDDHMRPMGSTFDIGASEFKP
jgi:hypothetical protein